MSNIEWTDGTWNPVVGCTPVSAGCLNCYAAKMARRLEGMGVPGYEPWWVKDERSISTIQRQEGVGYVEAARRKHLGQSVFRIAEVRGGRAVFTGQVRCLPERLGEPLKWKKPRRVFVNSMSDLFHEAVPFDFVDRIFAVMALCPQHTFQILTKRPERMAEFFEHRGIDYDVLAFMAKNAKSGTKMGETAVCIEDGQWKLPNVWLGTSVEHQDAADERIPHLLRCPGPVRFLSCEPLLGPVDLSAFLGGQYAGLPGDVVHDRYNFGIGWVIAGGESGPKARGCDLADLRLLRDQCKAAGVPFFMKQLGSHPRELPTHVGDGSGCRGLRDQKGGDPAEWPEDLRVREMPGVTP